MAMDCTSRVAGAYCVATTIDSDVANSIVVYCNTYRTPHLHYIWSASICTITSCVSRSDHRMVDVRKSVTGNAW